MQTATGTMGSLAEAVGLLRDCRRISITAHVNPDADAIGSVIGLTLGLRALGKHVTPVLSDAVPDYAMFLEGAREIESVLPPPEDVDLVVCLDAAGIDRIGRLYTEDPQRFTQGLLLNVDHHRTNPLFGTANWVEPAASSTSQLVFTLLSELGAPISPSCAEALLFGISGDTGSFQNGATTPASLQVAGELIQLGADVQRVSYWLFEKKRFVAAKLWGRMIGGIDLDAGRKIVFCFMSSQMLRDSGATVDETEGVGEFLRGVEESEVVMLLKENEDGSVRVSMRSRPAVDVSAIAVSLGGGGHRQAAGCTVAGPLDAARRVLIEAYDARDGR